ncbi:MAG: CinA family protein [Alphaproteobacteria bacterium]|nr:CinA family protein [Alphaproteobacteria bacterium]
MSPTTLAKAIVERACKQKIIIVLAESCTGGLIASALTDIPGSSAVLDRGFVTYSNDAKIDLLGVSDKTLADHGAVSAETAIAMTAGALAATPRAALAASVTGIAGPGGGSPDKPVGLVHFSCQRRGNAAQHERHK